MAELHNPTINVDVPSLTRNIVVTVHLQHMGWFKIRTWISIQIMRIACAVGGFGFDVDG